MRYLIAGSTGLLGSAFMQKLGPEANILPRLNLQKEYSNILLTAIKDSSPDIVINCAANVNAEQAEEDPRPVYEVNVDLPKRLAQACRQIDIPIVHFSSTGCYGAWKDTPYTEDDEVFPTTIHHTSKVAGEKAIRDACPDHLIIRTGWLFGGQIHHRKNFVWQRLLEASQNSILTSDQTQRGCPTNVDDVVDQTVLMISQRLRGTFNCVSNGTATRYEYVAKIMELFNYPCKIVPSGAFKRLAPVSPNETAVNQRLKLLNLDEMPHWVAGLIRYRDEVVTWPEWHDLRKTKDDQ